MPASLFTGVSPSWMMPWPWMYPPMQAPPGFPAVAMHQPGQMPGSGNIGGSGGMLQAKIGANVCVWMFAW